MTTTPADIIENARKAKTFIACAGEGPIPDQLLLRAAVAYNMLARQGWLAPVKDDGLDLEHAIAQISANFSDDPPNTVHRRKLFATPLDEAAVAKPEAPPVDPRQMSLLEDPVADRVASIVAYIKSEAKSFRDCADSEQGKAAQEIASRLYGKASLLRELAGQIERGDDLEARTFTADPAGTITHPEVTGRSWQRGDLVLVDGTKEGCVISVNGNVAQVSMWAAQAAVVNVGRLSPLEPQKQHVPETTAPGCGTERVAGKDIGMHAFKQVVKAISEASIVPDADGFYTLDAVIDPTPAIRCKPEVGVVLAGPDGPILTVDPLDGGNVWEVNIGDVVRWYEAHKAKGTAR